MDHKAGGGTLFYLRRDEGYYVPQKICLILIVGPMTVMGERGLCRWDHVIATSHWIKVGPDLTTAIFRRRGQLDTDMRTHRDKAM